MSGLCIPSRTRNGRENSTTNNGLRGNAGTRRSVPWHSSGFVFCSAAGRIESRTTKQPINECSMPAARGSPFPLQLWNYSGKTSPGSAKSPSQRLDRTAQMSILLSSPSIVRRSRISAKQNPSTLEENCDKSWGAKPPIMRVTSLLIGAGTDRPACGNRVPDAGAGDCKTGSTDPTPSSVRPQCRSRRDRSTRISGCATGVR
jgi:hypothetical protein